jgi:hypothetical protein
MINDIGIRDGLPMLTISFKVLPPLCKSHFIFRFDGLSLVKHALNDRVLGGSYLLGGLS